MDVCQDWSIDEVIERIRRIGPAGIVGIAGPPAVGKSTLAEDLCRALNAGVRTPIAQFCPMDGYHFPNVELERLGLRRFKGRIDTFDVVGYVAALRRIRSGEREFYWPTYSRVLHDVVRDGIWIAAESRIFITEGNYLLAGTEAWRDLVPLIDLKIYLDGETALLADRLRARHLKGGLTLVQAEAKMQETDLPNARFIAQGRDRADLVLGERRSDDFGRWRGPAPARSRTAAE